MIRIIELMVDIALSGTGPDTDPVTVEDVLGIRRNMDRRAGVDRGLENSAEAAGSKGTLG